MSREKMRTPHLFPRLFSFSRKSKKVSGKDAKPLYPKSNPINPYRELDVEHLALSGKH
jgi:hypothetical protein